VVDEDIPKHDGEVNNYDDRNSVHPWTILGLCYRVDNNSDDIVTLTVLLAGQLALYLCSE